MTTTTTTQIHNAGFFATGDIALADIRNITGERVAVLYVHIVEDYRINANDNDVTTVCVQAAPHVGELAINAVRTTRLVDAQQRFMVQATELERLVQCEKCRRSGENYTHRVNASQCSACDTDDFDA